MGVLKVKTLFDWPTRIWWPAKGQECAQSFTTYPTDVGSVIGLNLQKAFAAELNCSLFFLTYSKVGRLTALLIRHETLSRSLIHCCPFNQKGKIKLSLPCLTMGVFVENHIMQQTWTNFRRCQELLQTWRLVWGWSGILCSLIVSLGMSEHLKMLVEIRWWLCWHGDDNDIGFFFFELLVFCGGNHTSGLLSRCLFTLDT